MHSLTFRCPKCGGPYFSTRTGLLPEFKVLEYICDCNENGGHAGFWKFDENGKPVPKEPAERAVRPCGWRGKPWECLIETPDHKNHL